MGLIKTTPLTLTSTASPQNSGKSSSQLLSTTALAKRTLTLMENGTAKTSMENGTAQTSTSISTSMETNKARAHTQTGALVVTTTTSAAGVKKAPMAPVAMGGKSKLVRIEC